MRRYALRDDQWDRIQDFLPGREGHVGGTAADNRLFVEAVLCIDFGPASRGGIFQSVSAIGRSSTNSFGRWAKSGVFDRVFTLFGERSRRRIHDDRRHDRARSPA